jgi:hypothetical protein
MPRSRTCQWKLVWNSEPLSVWITSTWKGSFLEDVVEELDCRGLVVLRVDPQYSKPGAVVDRGVLVVALGARSGDWLDELHVDLDLVPPERFS